MISNALPHLLDFFWYLVFYRATVICLRYVPISFSIVKKDRYGFPPFRVQLAHNVHMEVDVWLT